MFSVCSSFTRLLFSLSSQVFCLFVFLWGTLELLQPSCLEVPYPVVHVFNYTITTQTTLRKNVSDLYLVNSGLYSIQEPREVLLSYLLLLHIKLPLLLSFCLSLSLVWVCMCVFKIILLPLIPWSPCNACTFQTLWKQIKKNKIIKTKKGNANVWWPRIWRKIKIKSL